MAHLRVPAGVLVGRQRGGEAGRVVTHALAAEADRDALEHQRRESRAPAIADAADDGALVERDIVEEDLVELRLAGDLTEAPNRHSHRVHRHDEHRQALVLGHIGTAAAPYPPLGSQLALPPPYPLPLPPPP